MKSEASQHIYRMHDPCIKTEFGRTAMTEEEYEAAKQYH